MHLTECLTESKIKNQCHKFWKVKGLKTLGQIRIYAVNGPIIPCHLYSSRVSEWQKKEM